MIPPTSSRSAFPGKRVWAIFEPRSATSCRRIFQEDFARALSAADHVVLPAVFRSTLPEDQRLSAEQVVSDLQRVGVFDLERQAEPRRLLLGRQLQ